jgi:hypothetical protein
MQPSFRLWLAAGLLLSFRAQAATAVSSPASSGGARYVSAAMIEAIDPGFNWTYAADTEPWAYLSVHSLTRFHRISGYGSNPDGAFGVDLFLAVSTPTTTCCLCGANRVLGGGDFSSNLLPSAGLYSQSQVHKTFVAGDLHAYDVDVSSSVTWANNKL